LLNGSTIRLDTNNALPDATDVLLYGNTVFNVNGRTDTIGGLLVGSSSDTNATVNLGTNGNLTVTDNSMPGGSPTNAGANFHAKLTGTGSITYNHSSSDTANWYWLNTTNDFSGTINLTRGRLNANDNTLGAASNGITFNGDIVATLGNGQGKASLQQTSGANVTYAEHPHHDHQHRQGRHFLFLGRVHHDRGRPNHWRWKPPQRRQRYSPSNQHHQ
jgi:hypothetical protein